MLLISMGFYTYQKWTAYSFALRGIETNKLYTEILGDSVVDEKAEYDDKRAAFDELNEEIANKLQNIFPAEDNYTELTRQLDVYEKDLKGRNNEFEVSSLDYQQAINTEGATYSVLPFRMNIRSSVENFTNFLHLIESSGSLDEEIRLMDISSIRLSFPGESDEANQPIQFSVQLNAYYQ